MVLIKPQSWARHGLKSWIEAHKKRLHHNVLAIALANKLARIAWAVLAKGRDYEMTRAGARVENRRGLDTIQAAGWCKQVIDRDKPARLNIDVGGVGAGVVDRLRELGYGDRIEAVNFGSKPFEPPPVNERGRPGGGPLNRRAEMYQSLKDWLSDPAGVSIPDRDLLCERSYLHRLEVGLTAMRVLCWSRRIALESAGYQARRGRHVGTDVCAGAERQRIDVAAA